MTWYLEGLLPGWILLALILGVIRRDLWVSLTDPCVGLAAYGMARIGLGLTASRPLAGGALFMVGHAVLFGWAVSPGGTRLLWSPIGTLTRYWPESVGRDVLQAGERHWSINSFRMAGVILAIDALMIACIAKYYYRFSSM